MSLKPSGSAGFIWYCDLDVACVIDQLDLQVTACGFDEFSHSDDALIKFPDHTVLAGEFNTNQHLLLHLSASDFDVPPSRRCCLDTILFCCIQCHPDQFTKTLTHSSRGIIGYGNADGMLLVHILQQRSSKSFHL